MRGRSVPWLWLGMILGGALLLRAALAAFVFASTRDTSVIGIMAVQILEGASPLFYAGQNYMGALEAYVVAAVFGLFGVSPFTLAVAPTLFAVLWCGSMYALFRRLSGRVAGGLAAAACAAFGGRHALWYTMGAYGGYPEMLLFGTLSLVLVFDLTGCIRTLRGTAWRWLALGLVLALGVWTNLQVMPFFVVAGGWLLLDWWQCRRGWRHLAVMAATGVLGLVGFLPLLLVNLGGSGGSETHMGFAGLRQGLVHARLTLFHTLPPLIWRPDATSFWIRTMVLVSIALPLAVYSLMLTVRRWRHVPDDALRTAWWVPVAYTFVFLALYLPHPLAAARAPRYLIGAFTVMIGAGFAALVCVPLIWGRRLGWSLLAIWCGYNVVFTLDECMKGAPVKAQTLAVRARTVVAAREAGLRHVKIIGGLADQLRGAMLTMTREREVRFLAFQDERILEHQQGWERDETGGYAFSPGLQPYFSGALMAMGIEDSVLTRAPGLLLLGGMVPSPVRLQPAGIRDITVAGMDGEAGWLTDGVRATGVGPGSGTVHRVVVALAGRPLVGGMRLFPVAHDLPRGPYSVDYSVDGVDFTPIVTNMLRSGESYISGNRVYFKDYDPAQDHRWPPVEAAYLRLTIAASAHSSWRLSEIRVFEHHGPTGLVTDVDVERMATALETNGVDYVFADRWMSSRLETRRLMSGQGPRTPPPMNIRYPATMRARVVFSGPAQAVLVATGMADEAEQRLRQSQPDWASVIAQDFGHYRLLRLDGIRGATPDPPLYWNGHTLLE